MFNLAALKGRFSASLKFPITAVQLSLWTNISNRFQMISVMFSFIHICKICPTYQTSSLPHILLIARSIWLHGIMWNKHCGVPAPHAISALSLCVAAGGLVQHPMMYQWMSSGVLCGGEKYYKRLTYWSWCWRLAAFVENAQNEKTGSWGMEQGEDNMLYLFSSLYLPTRRFHLLWVGRSTGKGKRPSLILQDDVYDHVWVMRRKHFSFNFPFL